MPTRTDALSNKDTKNSKKVKTPIENKNSKKVNMPKNSKNPKTPKDAEDEVATTTAKK